MSRHDGTKWNPPLPGAGDPARFTVDHNGYVVGTLADGTTLSRSASIEVHLLYAILRQLEGRSS